MRPCASLIVDAMLPLNLDSAPCTRSSSMRYDFSISASPSTLWICSNVLTWTQNISASAAILQPYGWRKDNTMQLLMMQVMRLLRPVNLCKSIVKVVGRHATPDAQLLHRGCQAKQFKVCCAVICCAVLKRPSMWCVSQPPGFACCADTPAVALPKQPCIHQSPPPQHSHKHVWSLLHLASHNLPAMPLDMRVKFSGSERSCCTTSISLAGSSGGNMPYPAP